MKIQLSANGMALLFGEGFWCGLVEELVTFVGHLAFEVRMGMSAADERLGARSMLSGALAITSGSAS